MKAVARQMRAGAIGIMQSAHPLLDRLGVLPDTDEGAILVRWWRGAPNWGDALNPVLIEKISGKRVVASNTVWNLRGQPVYSVVGSLLDNVAEPNLIVWGSGFMHEGGRVAVRPREVTAVRGPLSREILHAQGIACPAVYGDPALLYPEYFVPERQSVGRIGLIPHFTDHSEPLVQELADKFGFDVINICGGVEAVARAVCSCDWIVSSSLHGLIAADAYGVPSVWVRLSHNVLGGNFKFNDYFLGVGRPRGRPLEVTTQTTLGELEDQKFAGRIDFDRERLLSACPFRVAG